MGPCVSSLIHWGGIKIPILFQDGKCPTAWWCNFTILKNDGLRQWGWDGKKRSYLKPPTSQMLDLFDDFRGTDEDMVRLGTISRTWMLQIYDT